jgi:hypothetical protein
MEATVFTGWIYDHLQPHAAGLKVAHPLMLRAIAEKSGYRTSEHDLSVSGFMKHWVPVMKGRAS